MNQIFGPEKNDDEKKNNNPYINRMQNNNYEQYQNYNNAYNNYTTQVNYKKTDITKIVRVFCIMIFVFGILVIGKAVFGFTIGKTRIKDEVELATEQMGKEVVVTINSANPIKEFKYKWQSDQETVVQGTGDTSFSKTIEIPRGNNILNMTVVDCYDNKDYYQKQYFFESDDETKPTIELASAGNEIIITAKDENQMAYITYKWNDEDEIRIEADEDESTIEQKIPVKVGQNDLTITAFDAVGNRQVRKEKIIGDDKPEVNLVVQNNQVVITAKDDEGIKKIVLTVDGNVTDSGDEPINQKEVTATMDITPGNHTISVVVTNINNLEAKKELTATN